MVKVTESEFNEQRFYLDQGKDFLKRINSLDDDATIALGRMVHDLPKNMHSFKRDRLIANHRDHEVFKKLCVDITFLMREMGKK